ncbi:mor transcription activator family protein [Burkholderia sp. MSHR3999]|uniref:Mor transcription activator family protein n=1 Tax=Burkholderia sp. MSHR3999 TaxID=1542965 RepID=UPI0005AC1A36|nr:Mor transcription activator family protein [Burkholderia sp. MSHR3999]KIP18139.1 mor transcription activator family protein [Burkholderia sp. MSHR3999]
MNLGDVEHLLPRTARTLIAVIGLPATNALIRAMPGVVFPVPKRKTRSGEARFEELAEVIGVEAAEKLCKHFGGESLDIPTCRDAVREMFHRQLRSEFDQITRAHSAVFAVSRLAASHRMSSRQIWRILKMPDKDSVHVEQMNLF